MMASASLAEGDDAKLIKKFICDDGLLNNLKENGPEVYRLCGKTPPLAPVKGEPVG